MDIYFLRHANAGEPKLNPARDEKRPLDKLGIEQSHDVGRALAALDVTVDAIISSPLRRATQTASVVANEIGYEDKVVTDVALEPGASYEQFQELLARHSRKDAIMVVGHNPSMTEFINKMLAGGAALHAVELKKGSVARVEKVGRKPAMLRWFMTPKMVRSIQQASASNSRPKTVSK
ncbi:MAG: phosphohistidine phosphatase SixA [Candidatus Korobacteraceae bacterium]